MCRQKCSDLWGQSVPLERKTHPEGWESSELQASRSKLASQEGLAMALWQFVSVAQMESWGWRVIVEWEFASKPQPEPLPAPGVDFNCVNCKTEWSRVFLDGGWVTTMDLGNL